VWQAAHVSDRTVAPASRIWRSPAGYLSVMLVGSLLTDITLLVARESRVFGLPAVALVMLGCLALAAVLWWRCPRAPTTSPALGSFLAVFGVTWIYMLTLSVIRAESVAVPAIAMAVLLAMLWLKPPSRIAASEASDVFAWVLVGGTLVTLALEVLGIVPSWYTTFANLDLAAADRDTYWLPLADLLGLDGRWAGPFVHPNFAGPVGAFLVVFGATRRGARRLVFMSVGILVILLAGSRSAAIAALAGLVVLVMARWLVRPSRVPRVVRAVLVSAPLVLAAVYVFVRNPGLTGRTSVWPDMVTLWQKAPVLGIGDQGFAEAIDSGALPIWAHHAHDVLLDALVRTGVVGFALVLALMTLATVITARAARSGSFVGIAIVGMLLVGGLADTILHWRYLTVPSTALLLAVLIAAGATSDEAETRVEPGEPRPAQVPGSDPVPDPGRTPAAER
jgi:O-Antigen ligase